MGNRSNLYKQLNSGSFLFPNRIGRLEYFARALVLGLVTALLSTLLEHTENLFLQLFLAILTLAIIVASFWIYLIPRMRDLGWKTKLAWLALIPGINIFMGLGLLFLPAK